MDSQVFYLIKDIGTPTFLVAVLTYGWYKLGVRTLATLEKNNMVIEKNTKVIERILSRLK